MEAHNRKPIYFKSTNPGLAQVDEITSKLFQWDGSGSTPFEVGQGESWMPPQETIGEYTIWSDTHTLGYTAEGVAGPIFFTDGAMGDDKILQIINAVAYRLGEPMFNDVAAAKAWALTETRIYVKDDTANRGTIISTTGISGNGLIAELDSAYASSYSGTGSVWTDLTGNGHNATLTGSTYSSNNGGVFEFSTGLPSVSFNVSNSISEFSVNNNISENGGFTAQVWVYRDNLPAVNIINKTGEYGIRTLRDTYTIGTNISGGPYSTPVSHSQWQLITLQGFSIDPGTDGYVSPTHSWAGQEQVALRSYFNGIKNLNANNSAYDYYIDGTLAPGSSTNNPLVLGASTFSGNNFTGKIGAFYFYNRVLTEQEVLDNFNVTKSRFGL